MKHDDDDDFSPYDKAQFGAVLPDDPEIKMRAGTQRAKLFNFMSCGDFFTLEELTRGTGIQAQSIGARLRDFRKPQYGGHFVPKKMITPGVWMYRLVRVTR